MIAQVLVPFNPGNIVSSEKVSISGVMEWFQKSQNFLDDNLSGIPHGSCHSIYHGFVVARAFTLHLNPSHEAISECDLN